MIDIHLYCLFKYLCCSQFVHTSCSPEHTPPSPIMSKQSAMKRLFMRGSFTGRLSDGVDCVATLLFVMLQLADVEERVYNDGSTFSIEFRNVILFRGLHADMLR